MTAFSADTPLQYPIELDTAALMELGLILFVITLIVLIIAFALAVVWISKQGGWKGEGCGGNCASCHSRCENPDHGKKH